MNIINFACSKDGWQLTEIYRKQFGGHFSLYEPDADVLYYGIERDGKRIEYMIPEDETPERFRSILLEGIRSGVDLIPRKYDVAPPLEYDPDCDY